MSDTPNPNRATVTESSWGAGPGGPRFSGRGNVLAARYLVRPAGVSGRSRVTRWQICAGRKPTPRRASTSDPPGICGVVAGSCAGGRREALHSCSQRLSCLGLIAACITTRAPVRGGWRGGGGVRTEAVKTALITLATGVCHGYRRTPASSDMPTGAPGWVADARLEAPDPHRSSDFRARLRPGWLYLQVGAARTWRHWSAILVRLAGLGRVWPARLGVPGRPPH